MQKHNSQAKVIHKMCLFVSMAACRKVCLAHLSAHTHLLFFVICVIGGRAMGVFMCVVFVCCVRKIKQ